jgi:iron complex outermembrane recepter protein
MSRKNAFLVRVTKSCGPRISRLGLLALAAMGPAFAQNAGTDNSANQIEEVVVTAQRREESLQDVPLSIVALGSGITT